MTSQQLGRRVATSQRLSDTTLAIWCYALNYIFEHGYTDITDAEFVKTGKERFKISSHTLINHLRRMARVGLLKRFRMVENEDLLLREPSIPRVFIRYTMPGFHAQSLYSRQPPTSFGRRGHDYTPAEDRVWNKRFASLSKPRSSSDMR